MTTFISFISFDFIVSKILIIFAVIKSHHSYKILNVKYVETIKSRLKVVIRQGDKEETYYTKGFDDDCQSTMSSRVIVANSEDGSKLEIYRENRYYTDNSEDSDIPSLYLLSLHRNYDEPVYVTTDFNKAKSKFIDVAENIRKDYSSMEGYTETGDMFDRCIEFRRGNYLIEILKMREIKLFKEDIILH